MTFVIPFGCLFLNSWKAKNYPSILTCLGGEKIHASYNPCGFENIVAKWACLISQGYIYKVGYNLSGRHSENNVYSCLPKIYCGGPEQCNVNSENKYTKRRSNTLLRLVYLFSEQTLVVSALNSHYIDRGSIPHTFT